MSKWFVDMNDADRTYEKTVDQLDKALEMWESGKALIVVREGRIKLLEEALKDAEDEVAVLKTQLCQCE